jgi:hypothetical protein
MLKYVLAWMPMVPIAIANAALRQLWYGKYVAELRAHQISTATALLFFSLYIWVVIRRWRPASAGQALIIGVLWLMLTIAFEVLFGRYVAGLPWSRLVHDYNLGAGRVWVLIPLWLLVAPYVFYLCSDN